MLGALPPANAANLTGLEFFPRLIAGPFHDGLVIVFWLAIGMAVVGALASLLRSPAGAAEEAFVAHQAEVESLRCRSARPLTPVTAGGRADRRR